MTRTIQRGGFQKGNKVGHRFKKGEVNSLGRPPTAKCIPDILRNIGDRPVDPFLLTKIHALYGPQHNPKTMREGMLLAAYADALKGDTMARAFITERTEGKVTDEVNFNNEQTITHKHSFNFGKMSVDDINRLREIVAKGTAEASRSNTGPRISRPLSPSLQDN